MFYKLNSNGRLFGGFTLQLWPYTNPDNRENGALLRRWFIPKTCFIFLRILYITSGRIICHITLFSGVKPFGGYIAATLRPRTRRAHIRWIPYDARAYTYDNDIIYLYIPRVLYRPWPNETTTSVAGISKYKIYNRYNTIAHGFREDIFEIGFVYAGEKKNGSLGPLYMYVVYFYIIIINNTQRIIYII